MKRSYEEMRKYNNYVKFTRAQRVETERFNKTIEQLERTFSVKFEIEESIRRRLQKSAGTKRHKSTAQTWRYRFVWSPAAAESVEVDEYADDECEWEIPTNLSSLEYFKKTIGNYV